MVKNKQPDLRTDWNTVESEVTGIIVKSLIGGLLAVTGFAEFKMLDQWPEAARVACLAFGTGAAGCWLAVEGAKNKIESSIPNWPMIADETSALARKSFLSGIAMGSFAPAIITARTNPKAGLLMIFAATAAMIGTQFSCIRSCDKIRVAMSPPAPSSPK